MANQISTIILNVDLECRNCSKKIKKTVCKLQEREDIHTIAFDEKKNTVTISGPFDPEKICKKICCKAGKVIKGIEIKDNKEKPKDAKTADKPKDAKPADKPKDAKPADSAGPKKDKPKDAEPKKDKPKDAEPQKKDKDKGEKPKEPEPKSEKPKDPEPKKNKVDPPPPELLKVNGPPAFVVPEPQFGYQPPVWQPGTSCGCGSGYGYGGIMGITGAAGAGEGEGEGSGGLRSHRGWFMGHLHTRLAHTLARKNHSHRVVLCEFCNCRLLSLGYIYFVLLLLKLR